MSITDYLDRVKPAGILYVDTYVYCLDEEGVPWHLALKRPAEQSLGDTWQPISGKIKTGEKVRHAFVRQTITKTGRTPIELYALDTVNIFYDDFYDTVMLVPCGAARLPSRNVEVNREYHVDSAWFRAEEASAYFIWPNQLKCIDELDARLRRGVFSKFKSLPLGE